MQSWLKAGLVRPVCLSLRTCIFGIVFYLADTGKRAAKRQAFAAQASRDDKRDQVLHAPTAAVAKVKRGLKPPRVLHLPPLPERSGLFLLSFAQFTGSPTLPEFALVQELYNHLLLPPNSQVAPSLPFHLTHNLGLLSSPARPIVGSQFRPLTPLHPTYNSKNNDFLSHLYLLHRPGLGLGLGLGHLQAPGPLALPRQLALGAARYPNRPGRQRLRRRLHPRSH